MTEPSTTPSSPSTPTFSGTPTGGAGSTDTPTPPVKGAAAPDLEAGKPIGRATSAESLTGEETTGEEDDTTDRDKNTIVNVRD